MANRNHHAILKDALHSHNIEVWNNWRREHPRIVPNLRGVQLGQINHYSTALTRANLDEVDLRNATLQSVSFDAVQMRKATLEGADLRWTAFARANLKQANLSRANLILASFNSTDLSGANFKGASRYFVIAVIATPKPNELRQTLSQVRREAHLPPRFEFRFNHFASTKLRTRRLEALARAPFESWAIIVDKTNISSAFKVMRHYEFYLFFVTELLQKIPEEEREGATLILDEFG